MWNYEKNVKRWKPMTTIKTMEEFLPRTYKLLCYLYENVWNVWKCMKMYVNPWKCMRMYENVRKCMKMMKMLSKLYENVWKCMIMYENAWKCLKMHENEKIRKWGGSKKHVSADITSIKSEAFLATCVGGYFGRPQGDVWPGSGGQKTLQK